ncbi:hypothetical protein [Cryobacterium sp. Y57]|uniref:hypothetical protein n=1 Tax=Cryobacterium sp. Y57 TaxID=2048287 RepID=UPI000CE39647|nr:hypothetical protein [Cryobacterium sp. Y57]
MQSVTPTGDGDRGRLGLCGHVHAASTRHSGTDQTAVVAEIIHSVQAKRTECAQLESVPA